MVKKLERKLGLGAVVAICIGSMIGSGIFVLPGVAFPITGPSLYLAFFLASICILPAAVSKSELASAMPTSGGTYIYLERTFGPLAGTVSGLGLFLSMLLKASFALVGFASYLEVLANIPVQLTALVLLTVIVFVNILGVGKVSSIVGITVMTSIIAMGLLSAFAISSKMSVPMEPFLAHGKAGLMAATAIVFVAFAGVTKVAAIAEEIKDPKKNLPKGILFSLILVTSIYCAVTYVLAHSIPLSQLSGDLRPVYTLAISVGGPTIGIIYAVIAIVTMTSEANAGVLAASRFPFAMGRDKLLPSVFGNLSEKFLTPVWSIIACGIFMAVAILTLDIIKIAKLASSFLIMIYMVENIAVIVLRETRVQWYQPTYKSFAYPYLQLFGIVTSIALLFAIGGIVPIAISGICIPGFLIYFFYSRKRIDRKGVLGFRLPRKDLVEENVFLRRNIEEVQFTEKANVIVAMFGNEKSPEVLTELGLALADNTKLEVIHLTEIPEQTDLDDIISEKPQTRAIKRRVKHMSQRQGANVEFEPIVSHDIFMSLSTASRDLHCQWLVTEWGGKTHGAFTLHNPMGWLRDHLSCHLMTFRDKGVRYFKKILVIVRTEKSNELLLETADHLARVNDADITLSTYITPAQGAETHDWQKELLQGMGKRCKHFDSTLIMTGKSEWKSYVTATEEFDLVIFEDVPATNLYRRSFGTTFDKLMEHSICSVVSVRPSRAIIQSYSLRQKILEGAKSWGRRK